MKAALQHAVQLFEPVRAEQVPTLRLRIARATQGAIVGVLLIGTAVHGSDVLRGRADVGATLAWWFVLLAGDLALLALIRTRWGRPRSEWCAAVGALLAIGDVLVTGVLLDGGQIDAMLPYVAVVPLVFASIMPWRPWIPAFLGLLGAGLTAVVGARHGLAPEVLELRALLCVALGLVGAFLDQARRRLLVDLANEGQQLASAREAETQQTRRLRTILAVNPVTVYTCEAAEPFAATFIAHNVETTFGFGPSSFLDDPGFWASRIHPDDAPAVFEGLAALFELGRHAHEYRWRASDGRWVWVYDQLVLLRDEQGQPLEIIGTWMDITERKLVERAVEASEKRLQAILAAVPDTVLRLKTDGALLDVHASGDQTSEAGPSPVHGASLSDLLTPIAADVIERAVAEATADPGRVVQVEYRLGGEQPKSFEGRLVASGSSEVVAIIRDVSRWKNHEATLEAAWKEAEAAARAKSEFLANMSHEVRTPMNAVLGMVHLARRTELTPKQEDYLGKADRSAQSLLRIIDDILDASKIEAGQLVVEQVPFSLRDVVERVASQGSVQAEGKALEVSTRIAPGVPARLVGDPVRLGQVLSNLMSNAVKFTPAGSVLLTVTQVARLECGLTLRFSVRDTGIGMSDDQLGRVFQPFLQADASMTRRFGGTGLGLAISRDLCRLMGGTLEVTSEPDVGSTFQFTAVFGLADAPGRSGEFVADGRQVGAAGVLRAIRGARFLLAEDNEINRQVARELLVGWGGTVTVVSDGEEAVMAATTEDYDLVLMDIQMPRLDGIRAAQQIRSAARVRPGLATLPIVAMTAHAMDGDRASILEAGMNAHVTKPIDPEKLVAVLTRWLEPRVDPAATAPAEDSPLPPDGLPHLPGFDTSAALARVAGNRALYLRLLGTLRSGYAGAADEVDASVAAGDRDQARFVAHKVSGVAGNLGARDLHGAAATLEAALKADDGSLDSARAGFRDALERTVNVLAILDAPAADFGAGSGTAGPGVGWRPDAP